jgi:hypothetical protein
MFGKSLYHVEEVMLAGRWLFPKVATLGLFFQLTMAHASCLQNTRKGKNFREF